MTFDWIEYYKLAAQLAGDPQTASKEAMLRSAISRAYYAAFNRAKMKYSVGDSAGRARNSHEEAILAIEQCGSREHAACAVDLRRMKDLRHRADYDAQPFPRLRDNAKLALMLAEKVFEIRSQPRS